MMTIKFTFPDEATALTVAAGLFGVPDAVAIPQDGYLVLDGKRVYYNALVWNRDVPGYHVLTQIDAVHGELAIPEAVLPFIRPLDEDWGIVWG